MGIFAKLFNKNTEKTSSKNMEDFISLTRVYFQSVMAVNLGITNIRFIPDVANFKHLFKIPTVGGRLGQGEKAASRKMLMQDYNISENFFKEIDTSIKKNCRTQKPARVRAARPGLHAVPDRYYQQTDAKAFQKVRGGDSPCSVRHHYTIGRRIYHDSSGTADIYALRGLHQAVRQ